MWSKSGCTLTGSFVVDSMSHEPYAAGFTAAKGLGFIKENWQQHK